MAQDKEDSSKTRGDLVAMLEDLAENSSSEIARLQAIKTLLELDGEDDGKQEESPLYPSDSKSAARAAPTNPQPKPWTLDHFFLYAARLVFDDGETHEPEEWQLAFVEDVFEGRAENWLITPEGNGKTTFTAELALCGADFTDSPWIPVGAASSKQARILHDQAGEFVRRTPTLGERFRVFDGYLKIASRVNGGRGMEIFAADPKTGDGVIPFPFAIIDEGHRQEDMRLYRLWKGKLRKRGGQILMLSTASEPETPFENVRESIRRKGGTSRERAPAANPLSIWVHLRLKSNDHSLASAARSHDQVGSS